MNRSTRRFTRTPATLVLLALTALAVPPVAGADDWARDRARAAAYQELDPAIRTAIAAQTPSITTVSPTSPVASEPSLAANGFAWGAAAIGVLVGIGAACLGLACVTLVRNDGRLRSA
jgi:hypothetical protein